MKNRVDPRRFIGKMFTRRQTFATSEHDFGMWIDGVMVGRIMKVPRARLRVVWYWCLNDPYFPDVNSTDGEASCFESARSAFKANFWEWHVSAMKHEAVVA